MRAITSTVRIGTKGISLLAVSFSSLLAASAANAETLYVSYQDSVQLQSGYTSDNAPSINNDGLPRGSKTSPDVINAPSTWTAPELLFEVDPNACLRSGSRSCAATSGPLDATVSVTLSFYSGPGGSLLGTLTDTAQADFLYTGLGQGTDNICWQNSGVSSTILTLVSSVQTGTCSTTKSQNSGTGNEQIEILLAGVDYDIRLDDWTDWNEQPDIQFKDAPPTNVPEPFTLSLFAAGLAGAAAFRRRRTLR
jgi:hypothetical protein